MSDEKTVEQRFVAAWGAIKNPDLDSVNPHFKNKYASLKATLDVVREACYPQGIAYRQILRKTDEGSRELQSFVISGDGSILECSCFPVEAPLNPQAFGSNLTYAKRQQAQADWGITGENDDDGNAAADAACAGGRQNRPASKPSSRSQDGPRGAAQASEEDAELKAAKARLWEACKAYAEKCGSTPEEVSGGVKERADYEETVGFFRLVSEELEAGL